MSEQPAFLPRPGDLSRDEIAQMAYQAVAEHGGPTHVSVFFKFTCMWCGFRCTFEEPNKLYEDGECVKCGKTTKVDYAGFALRITPKV